MQELIGPFERLLAEHCAPAVVRKIEEGGDWRPLWKAVAESGFLDSLVSEDLGGFGLSLTDVAPLIALVGAHAMPLPVGETMVARALLARCGQEAPDGPIALATGRSPMPFGALADHCIHGAPAAVRLVALPGETGVIAGTLDRVIDAAEGLAASAAVIRAQLIAGAAGRLLETTVNYANERQQFGKPIGRQQAVQQQLAVLAEQAVAARISAAIGARGGLVPDLRAAAVAKIGTGIAAEQVAAIAHAVHGAIGISEEFDLQLLTRRLHLWRLADGSERYWAQRLGEANLGDGGKSALAFVLA